MDEVEQIRQIVEHNQFNYMKILKSKKNQHLVDFIVSSTQHLASQYHIEYTLKTRIYWLLNNIKLWNDEKLKCKVCGKSLFNYNVKKAIIGYEKKTCCKSCERKLATETCKQTMKDMYGVENAFQMPSFIEKMKQNQKQVQKKRDLTKRKNHNFKTSKKEDKAYEILCAKFGKDNIIRQHKSSFYPFNCDFYIKSIDTYIECNFSWTHGDHWFDSNDANDQGQLKKWKDKGTKFYQNAIETWTVRDVKKRRCAEENHLKFIVFWILNDVEAYVKHKV